MKCITCDKDLVQVGHEEFIRCLCCGHLNRTDDAVIKELEAQIKQWEKDFTTLNNRFTALDLENAQIKVILAEFRIRINDILGIDGEVKSL